MKVDELRERVISEKFDVIAITGTWATGDISDCELAIDGYVLYRQDRRPGIKGGGVMIMVKDSLNSRPLLQLSNSEFQESVWCQIHLDSSSLVLGVCYRSTASTSDNNEELLRLLKRATNVPLGTQILILGDFNHPDIDYINVDHGLGPGVGAEASRFLDVVRDIGLHQHVREFTRFRTGQIPSLLDYLFTDNEYVVDKLQCTSPLGKSDHVCIQFDYLAQHQTQPSLQPKLNYWKADFAAIRKELSYYDWEAEFLNRDVSECWHIFHDKLTSLSEKFVPPKKLNSAKRGNRGISKETVKEIKKREKAWIRYKSSGSDRHWQVYKFIRNRVVQLIRNMTRNNIRRS